MWQSGKQSTLYYIIDAWQNYGTAEGEKDTYQRFIEAAKKYHEIIMPLRGWSYDIAKNFNEKIVFIFIHGDPSYEGEKRC